MCQYVIELTGLTKKYGNFTAVNDLNLNIRKGEIFGLLGPNGAGKSTTILMMLGLTEPTSGSVHVCGINSTTHPVDVKRKVGYLPEDVGFYEDMTGIENILYTAALNGIGKKEGRAKAEQLLTAGGYRAYYLYRQKNVRGGLENTGFARPGKNCIYNVGMMSDRISVVGLGSGSSSKKVRGRRVERLHNSKDLQDYTERVEELAQNKVKFFI